MLFYKRKPIHLFFTLFLLAGLVLAFGLLTACKEEGADSSSLPGDSDTTPSQTTDSTTPTTSTDPGEVTVPEKEPVLDRYDLLTSMEYLWEGSVVYNESVMFVGKEDKAPLLYTPDKILSVRSSDLATEYKEGVDYKLEDGRLVLTENTSIPFMTVEEYYPTNPIPGGSFPTRIPEHANLRFGEGDTFHRYHVYVTYSHKDSWEGTRPADESAKFPKTLAKLKNGEETKIVFYGDSITEGYNASGFIKAAPYADPWAKMVADYLGVIYQNDKVRYINSGLASTDSNWGLANLQERVIAHAPDLLVLAFGMNEGGSAPSTHAAGIAKIIDAVQKALPDTEILLVSTMLPNEEAAGFWGNQQNFETYYKNSLAKRYPEVGIVPVTSLHRTLLETKPYYHMTGNNINHPNDFLSRVYAQAVVSALTGGAVPAEDAAS